jgi:group I intron endonuclease
MRIYKTTNKINGKIYVGKDVNHGPDYLGSGFLLHKAIKKYGRENFVNETIEECENTEQLNEREIFWIKELDSTNRKIGYNIAKGGTGGDTWTHLDDATKELVRKKRSEAGKKAYMDNPSMREKCAKNTKSIWQREGYREKIRDVMTGREIPWKDKISASIAEWHKTHKVNYTDEMRKRVSERMKGHEFTEVSEEVQSLALELYKTYGTKTVIKKLKERGIDLSLYLLKRVLAKHGVYKKWRKGKRS